MEHLLQKGVNVSEIESKKVATENRIEELDKKLEELPNVREGLVAKYREEKEERLKNNEGRDYLGSVTKVGEKSLKELTLLYEQ